MESVTNIAKLSNLKQEVFLYYFLLNRDYFLLPNFKIKKKIANPRNIERTLKKLSP